MWKGLHIFAISFTGLTIEIITQSTWVYVYVCGVCVYMRTHAGQCVCVCVCELFSSYDIVTLMTIS